MVEYNKLRYDVIHSDSQRAVNYIHYHIKIIQYPNDLEIPCVRPLTRSSLRCAHNDLVRLAYIILYMMFNII